ncbi:hypothetical protein ACWATR_35475 [Nostoc sp. UIC 10890]
MSEPITLTALFGASKATADISIRIAKSLKLIESIESKVDLLTQVEFNAAWKTLLQACNSSSSDEQKSVLINNARESFTNATCLEKGERLFYTYLGLAICHYLLDDVNNVKTALIEATKVSIYKDIYQQRRDSYLGFNKYGINSIINSYNPVNMLNLIKGIFAYPLLLAQKTEIQKYNKSKSDLIDHILRKINAEQQMIIMVTRTNQPSVIFTSLESKSLELINLQKQCIKIISNI